MLRNSLKWLRSAGYSPMEIAGAIVPASRFILLKRRHRRVSGGPVSIRPGSDVRIDSDANVRFGHYVRILRDFTARVEGVLSIGDDVFFNRGCYIAAKESVSIGNHCMFGEYVSIHDENHVFDSLGTPIREQGYVTSPITIGNNVWVGAKATILAGVKIGDNSVIGANAVVTKNIPANVVAVGIPARPIRTIESRQNSTTTT